MLKWNKSKKTKYISIAGIIATICVGLYILSYDIENRYNGLISVVIYDREHIPVSVKENTKGHYVYELTSLPKEFTEVLLQKEDRFFSYHPGINPFSTLRAIYHYIVSGDAGGSSTLTQQLTKNLLGTESDRTVKNKIKEALYAFSAELFFTKEEILLMYSNTVFLGNQVQGFETASQAYFSKSLGALSTHEQLSLLATLSHPSTRNPWKEENVDFTVVLYEKLFPEDTFVPPLVTDAYAFQDMSYFELQTAGVACSETCTTTIDTELTATIRNILSRHIEREYLRGVRNGAVVVINPKTSEVLSVVGSKNPKQEIDGSKINMAIETRPIGSTIKPFIYAKGFESGLRPYSLVEDREYKYSIATGFSLYPKNYDGKYRGQVTLHEALSNSLNVPAIKVLEYIGLQDFYTFLDEQLYFKPIQPYDNYQYGIALGGLEMDLLTLSHYFTTFPREGTIAPLQILKDSNENFNLPPQSSITQETKVFDKEHTQLVHAIISDRLSGVNQFGLISNLNLPIKNYGVKTGTSRDFHDSWVVGYTSDFVVGVWLGNAENTRLQQVTGQSGAGGVWHDVMQYLSETDYYTDTSPTAETLQRHPVEGSDEWGLFGDTVAEHRNLLQGNNLILSIYPGDTFQLRTDIAIPLRARNEVEWRVNGTLLEIATETMFSPDAVGSYEISAHDTKSDRREIVQLTITNLE